jgi:hypothetical protein
LELATEAQRHRKIHFQFSASVFQWQLFFLRSNKNQALHFSCGFAPHIPQAPPSFCINGLLLLQVPANLPSFFTNIFIAMPAKASAKRIIESRMIFIIKFTEIFSTLSAALSPDSGYKKNAVINRRQG